MSNIKDATLILTLLEHRSVSHWTLQRTELPVKWPRFLWELVDNVWASEQRACQTAQDVHIWYKIKVMRCDYFTRGHVQSMTFQPLPRNTLSFLSFHVSSFLWVSDCIAHHPVAWFRNRWWSDCSYLMPYNQVTRGYMFTVKSLIVFLKNWLKHSPILTEV